MQDTNNSLSNASTGGRNATSIALCAITIYCVCDELLRAMNHQDDRQCRLSCAEIMMVPILAALCFGGNGALCRCYLVESGAWKSGLSRSRFSRRLHQVPREAWALLQQILGTEFCDEAVNANGFYVVDSMPVEVCAPVRVKRSRLFPDQQNPLMWGYCASKKKYYYGFKVHLVVNQSGAPVRWIVLVASQSDINGFRQMELDLPQGSAVFGDAAYWDDKEAAYWSDWHEVELVTAKGKNARQPLEASLKKLLREVRGRVETSFSLFTDRWPRRPRATSAKGFCLFLNAALFALAFDCLIHH